MARYDLAPAVQVSLPKPPPVYDYAYMQRLVLTLEDQIRALTEPRQILASGMVVYNLPTVADVANLSKGEVYLDGTTLRAVP